jgi:amino acid adenylation domain-containing protein
MSEGSAESHTGTNSARNSFDTYKRQLNDSMTSAQPKTAWSAKPDAGPSSIHRLFEEQVRRTPNATAVSFGEECLSYLNLDSKSNQVARRLGDMGAGPESLVGLLTERSLEMVVGILGILKAGAAYVPIDSAYPPERQQFMLADSKIQALLTQRRFRERFGKSGEFRGPVLYLDDAHGWPDIETTENDAMVDVHAENAAYVIYTSGSTGRPKGVVVTHGNVLRLMRETERWYGFTQRDVWTMFHSYGFDFSVWELWGALLYGGRLVVVPYWVSRSTEEFLELAIREQVTVLNQTPSAFRQFMRADEERMGSGKLALRLVIFGGEALDLPGLRRWMERYGEHSPELVNMYGITETTVHVTYRPVRHADVQQAGLGSRIGVAIPDLQVHVLDEHMNMTAEGIAGEIYVGGPGLARGYLNRPELTAERFVPNAFSHIPGQRLYRSGDQARYLTEEELEYLGRGDDQVKLRGFRIELGEIETALAEQQQVRESAVLVEEDQNGEKRLAAYVVAEGVSKKELRGLLEARLPDYMVPAKIVLLDRMPLTENGKLDRKRLTEQASVMIDGLREERYVEPRTDLERAITDIWADLLGLERVGIHDNFFDLGGHSLLAMQMTSKTRELLSVNVGLKDIFELPTPAGLAPRVLSLLRNETPVRFEPLVRRNLSQAPLSFAQRTGWFLDHVMPDDSFVMSLAHRLKGKLDLDALEKSANEIIRRHEILRTRFEDLADDPVQVIEPELMIRLQREDLSDLAADNRESALKRRVHEEGRRGFNVRRLPLLRVCAFHVGVEDHVLLVAMHHIIGDGWSMKVFYRELEALYDAYRQGEDLQLEHPPVQYADFVCWQQQRFEHGRLQSDLHYWRRQLAGAPDVLRLPTDFQRPESLTYSAVNERFDLDEVTTEALRSLSRRSGVTLYMALLSACAVLLHRYSGQEDILIGTPIAVRGHEHLREVMGIFLNMVIMRVDLSGNPEFVELLKRVRETALAAYAHHEAPMERVVEELRSQSTAGRSLNRAPLSQIMFNMLDADDRALNLPGLKSSQIDVDDGAAKFDLTFEIQDRKSQLHVRIVHNSDLFAESTGREIRLRFQQVISEILKKEECRIGELDLLLAHEKSLAGEPAPMAELQESFLL